MQIAVIYPMALIGSEQHQKNVAYASGYLDFLERAGHDPFAVLGWEVSARAKSDPDPFRGAPQVHVLKLEGWRECPALWLLHKAAQATGAKVLWSERRFYGWVRSGDEGKPVVEAIQEIGVPA